MADKTHHILVIGVGSIGERHLRCFQKTERATVCLVEPNEELRKTIADRYDVKGAYASVDDALAAESIDGAVICTPAQYHIPIAQQLADKDIALLIEKPLSTTFDGIDQLIKTVEEKKLPCAVGYTWRSHPAALPMKEEIDSGKFGKPVQMIYTGGQHFPTYRPAYRDIYYAKHETGGGCIQDCVTHMVNLAEWFVGPVTKLIADAEHKVLEGVDVEDMSHYMTRHGDVFGSFAQNQFQSANETIITVVCENGTVQLRAHECEYRTMMEPDSGWTTHTFGPMERDTMYVNQANAFLDCVEGNQPARCSLAEGYQTLKVNLAALTSINDGQWKVIE